MKITKVEISDGIEIGLAPISMPKLGKIVLVAGRNGSGKTRLLNLIKSTINQKPKKSQIENSKRQLESHKRNFGIYSNEIKNSRNVTENQRHLDNETANITRQETFLSWDKIETDEISESYSCIDFVPKTLDLKDCNSFSKSQMDGHAKNTEVVGISNLPNGAFSKLQNIQNQWFEATHP